MQKTRVVLVTVVSMIFFASIVQAAEYYPLQEGLIWEYEVKLGGPPPANKTTKKLSRKNLESQTVGDKKVFPCQIDIEPDMMYFLYFAENEEGIAEVGVKKMNEAEPSMYETPYWILKNPLKAGSKWTYTTKTSVKLPPELDSVKEIDIPVQVEIDTVDETVKVPAGTFKKCIRVSQTYSLEHSTGEKKLKLTLERFEWYAPGVGFVKMTSKESVQEVGSKSKENKPITKEIQEQLTSFKKK